jgi:hypothetical protein
MRVGCAIDGGSEGKLSQTAERAGENAHSLFTIHHKKGRAMPQKRKVIDLKEIIHLEIHCGECNNLTLLPLEDPKGGATLSARYQCLFCNKKFTTEPDFQFVLEKIRESLASSRTLQSPFTVRLVIEQ